MLSDFLASSRNKFPKVSSVDVDSEKVTLTLNDIDVELTAQQFNHKETLKALLIDKFGISVRDIKSAINNVSYRVRQAIKEQIASQ